MTDTVYNDLLVKAASDVRRILSHLARIAKPVDDADAQTALGTVALIEAKTQLSVEQESQFWKAFSGLVKEALPAKVDALYAETSVDAATLNKQQQAMLKRVRKWSIAAFILTLLMLAYLSVTETVIKRNDALNEQYIKLTANIVKGTPLENIEFGDTATGTRQIEVVKSPTPEVRPPAPDARGGGATTATKDARLEGMIEAVKAQTKTLIEFNNSTLSFLQFGLGDLKAPDNAMMTPLKGSILAMQQTINVLISKYLLPVVAALLGVTVFILRSASTSIQELSFKWNDYGVYSNRMALGVIGGIAISWFAVTDTTGVIGSITPAALAFLVGYSVEVLYNVLDSLVKALGANEKASISG